MEFWESRRFRVFTRNTPDMFLLLAVVQQHPRLFLQNLTVEEKWEIYSLHISREGLTELSSRVSQEDQVSLSLDKVYCYLNY